MYRKCNHASYTSLNMPRSRKPPYQWVPTTRARNTANANLVTSPINASRKQYVLGTKIAAKYARHASHTLIPPFMLAWFLIHYTYIQAFYATLAILPHWFSWLLAGTSTGLCWEHNCHHLNKPVHLASSCITRRKLVIALPKQRGLDLRISSKANTAHS